MALVNNATTIGTGGQNLVLETAGHIYVKVNERYYELDFKNSGSEKLYGKPIVNEVVQPTEEVDLSDYITNDDLKKALKKYVTEKSWQDVMDTQSALQNSLLDFEEAIKPITVQTMQVVVGSEELQFDWIYSFTKTKGPNNSFVDSPLYIDMDESSTHYNQLVWNPGYIKHYTFDGPEIVRPEDSLGSSYSDDQLKKYWRWYIKNSEGNDELEEINMDGTFYVYLKVPHSSGYNKEGLDSLKSLNSSSSSESSESSESSNNSGTIGNGIHNANLDLDENGMPLQLVGTGIYAKTGIGQVVYSSEAIKFGPEHDETTGLNYYYLLYAIVTNSDGSPSISTLNGFTEILPGQIRAYIFATPNGDQYLDFLHGKFRIGSDTEYLEWNGTNLNIKGGISVTGGELKTELEKFQSPTDNEIECWFSDDGATNSWDLPLPNGDNEDNIKATPNWPVSTWGDNHAEHLGDFYYVVADNSNTTNINEKGLAYRYIKKDNKYYWDKVSDHSISKELYKVYQAKETADQALNKFSDWAADGVISPVEVNDIKTEYNFIVKDHEEQSYKATTLNLEKTKEWTNYNTAYNNYKTSLEKVFTWWNGIKSDPNTRTGTYLIPNDFQTNLEAYYSARSTFINLAFKNSTADVSYITAAIKKGKTDITGGLIMTGLIELGFGLAKPEDANYYDSFRVMSGINGICIKKDDNGNYDYTDPAVWFGGNNLDLENEADMNKPETCLLFIQKSDNTYNKYAKSDSTVVGTLYKWMKDDGTNYYSLDKDGDKLVHWSDSKIPLSSITLPSGGFKYSYSQLIQKTFTSPLSFGDSAGNQQILYGTIKAYLLQVINNNSYTVYNVLTKGTETLTGTFNSYIVKSHTSPGSIDLSKKTIITYTPTNSTSIEGFIFSLDDTLPLHYISYAGLIPTKENGFLYTFGSSSMMIIDVYKYIGTETYQLYKWTNDSGSIYTLDDYLTKPKYVYSYSNNTPTYLKNYTVADHFINWAKAMFRMNGSGYLANGNISWDKEGTLKIGESMTISSNGIIDLGYLHSGQSSFWIGTKSNKMLEVANNTCTINGSLRARAKDYYSGSFVSIEDSSGTMIADIGSTPLSTKAIPTYLRQTDDVGVFNAKGSVMYGAVNIPEGWEYQLIPWYYCYTDNERYKINYFNLEYSFARVSKEIELTIILRKSDGSVNYDTKVFTKTFNVSKSTQSGKITITNLSYDIRETGISLGSYFGYSLFMTLSPGQVKSGIKSDSHIIIRRGPCEAQITQTSASIKKGTYIRPNGISSVFGQNCKFQWLGAMELDNDNRFNKDYNYCDEGGTFIVTIPSIENGGTAKDVVGLEITGYRDSSGKPATPGISINLGDGWHKLKIENNTLKIVN